MVNQYATVRTMFEADCARRVQVASKVPAEAVKVNMDLVREGRFNPEDMERALSYPVRPSDPFKAAYSQAAYRASQREITPSSPTA